MNKVVRVSSKDINIINDLLENIIDWEDDESMATTHIQKMLADDRTYLFAAITEKLVVGYALVYRFPSLYSDDFLAYLYDIEVLKNHRRKGIGRLLIETILAQLKSDEVEELWLGTAIDNEEGQGLFNSTGAVKSGETFDEYTYLIT